MSMLFIKQSYAILFVSPWLCAWCASSMPGNAPMMSVPRLIVVALIMRIFLSLVAESEPGN